MAVGETIWKSWAEIFFLVLLLIGFILSISVNSALLTYFVILLAGLLAGRYYFLRVGKQPLFPFFLIIIGFLVGYIIGTFVANRLVVAVLFFIGWLVSHIVHKKGYLK